MYHMDQFDQLLGRVDTLFVDQCPMPKYKELFKRFDFENKSIYSAFSLIYSQDLSAQQQEMAVKFLTAV